jgi:hypothetical protein
MQAYSQRRELVLALLCLVLFVAGVWVARKGIVYLENAEQEKQQRRITESKDHFWMMNVPAPRVSIRFWLPAELGNHAECIQEFPNLFSRAEAYMEAVLLVQEGHFHVVRDSEYGGFRLDEFLDNRDGKGEFWAGRLRPIHYHGIWMDEETARNFLKKLAPQQHSAATPQFE